MMVGTGRRVLPGVVMSNFNFLTFKPIFPMNLNTFHNNAWINTFVRKLEIMEMKAQWGL